VRAGEIFGLTGGTIRVAISRMLANGELAKQERGYLLIGSLADRQARQATGRNPPTIEWDGQWEVVSANSAAGRGSGGEALRSAATTLRLARLRDGVWTRPRNLDPERDRAPRAVINSLCTTFIARPDQRGGSFELRDSLWDLESWAADARELRANINKLTARLERGDNRDLAPGFIESAAVLRLLSNDPLLPPELAPLGWPSESLRGDYAKFDIAYRLVLRKWLSSQP